MRTLRILAALLPVTGCIPVHWVQPASPPLYGRFRQADGTPAAGAGVAVSSDYRDPNRARASHRAYVDSTGVFRLSPTTIVQRWVLVIPPVEHFGNGYHFCAGIDHSLVHVAYQGSALAAWRIVPHCARGSYDIRARLLPALASRTLRLSSIRCVVPNDAGDRLESSRP